MNKSRFLTVALASILLIAPLACRDTPDDGEGEGRGEGSRFQIANLRFQIGEEGERQGLEN